jgi:murein DD-endopeptidase MepM/ murein hydrolase activator NlpD
MFKWLLNLILVSAISVVGSNAMAGTWGCPTDGKVMQLVKRGHNGVDIADRSKPMIGAARAGEVRQARLGWNSGYGNVVVITHSNPSRATRYAHLDSISVKQGDKVSNNQTIGRMGKTGKVSGPTGIHLHWEVRSAPGGTVYRTTNLAVRQDVTRGMSVNVND